MWWKLTYKGLYTPYMYELKNEPKHEFIIKNHIAAVDLCFYYGF